MRSITLVVLLACLTIGCCALRRVDEWQTIVVHDKHTALVYEVVYKPGHLHYREDYPSSDNPLTYESPYPNVTNPPSLDFWHSTAQRLDRAFGCYSKSAAYADAKVYGKGDVSLWVFRTSADQFPSAVVLGLAEQIMPPGAHGGEPKPYRLQVPARSVVYAAHIMRESNRPFRVDVGDTFFVGRDSRGGFDELARNNSDAPIDLEFSGHMHIDNLPGGPTDRHMRFSALDAGPNIRLVTGGFMSEPACFVAAVIIKPLP